MFYGEILTSIEQLTVGHHQYNYIKISSKILRPVWRKVHIKNKYKKINQSNNRDLGY